MQPHPQVHPHARPVRRPHVHGRQHPQRDAVHRPVFPVPDADKAPAGHDVPETRPSQEDPPLHSDPGGHPGRALDHQVHPGLPDISLDGKLVHSDPLAGFHFSS